MTESTLISRNLRIGRKRTCVRLEQAMWDALEEILERENRTIHELCTEIDRRRHESTLTAAVRVYILGYFMAAATGPGHADAGHGPIYRQAFRDKGLLPTARSRHRPASLAEAGRGAARGNS